MSANFGSKLIKSEHTESFQNGNSKPDDQAALSRNCTADGKLERQLR
jgi:hypothetical protein